MTRLALIAFVLACPCIAAAQTSDIVSPNLAAPPGLVNDGQRANYFETFEALTLGPLAGQSGWVGWGANIAVVSDLRMKSDKSARHTSDGSGWVGFELKSPAFTPAFGTLAADVCIRGEHATYQFSALGDVPTGNDGFWFNASVQFRPDRSIRVLQLVGNAGTFVDSGATWTPGVPLQVAIDVSPAGVLTVYVNAVQIFQGVELSLAKTGTAGRTRQWLGWVENAVGFAGESMTVDNFTNVLRALPKYCAGDVDCDGDVDFFDIDPLVTALNGEADYLMAHPTCLWLNGDCDGNAAVDFFDIDPFVARLSSVCQ